MVLDAPFIKTHTLIIKLVDWHSPASTWQWKAARIHRQLHVLKRSFVSRVDHLNKLEVVRRWGRWLINANTIELLTKDDKSFNCWQKLHRLQVISAQKKDPPSGRHSAWVNKHFVFNTLKHCPSSKTWIQTWQLRLTILDNHLIQHGSWPPPELLTLHAVHRRAARSTEGFQRPADAGEPTRSAAYLWHSARASSRRWNMD